FAPRPGRAGAALLRRPARAAPRAPRNCRRRSGRAPRRGEANTCSTCGRSCSGRLALSVDRLPRLQLLQSQATRAVERLKLQGELIAHVIPRDDEARLLVQAMV